MATSAKTFLVPTWRSEQKSLPTVQVKVLRDNSSGSPHWNFQVVHKEDDETLPEFVAEINKEMKPSDLAGLEGIIKLVEKYSIPWRPRVQVNVQASDSQEGQEAIDRLFRAIEVICEWASRKLALAPDLAQPTAK